MLGGKTLWVVSTSALLLGVPWALAWSEEQQMMEMEREMKMQQSANEVSFLFALLLGRLVEGHGEGGRGEVVADCEGMMRWLMRVVGVVVVDAGGDESGGGTAGTTGFVAGDWVW